MGLKGNALIFLSVKHKKLANRIIKTTKNIKSHESIAENKYSIYSFKNKLRISETKKVLNEPLMEIDLLKNLTDNSLKLNQTPILTHKFLLSEAKKRGVSKIIAKTWIFLQNPKIAEELGYKHVNGTGAKLIQRLNEISFEKNEKPHIKGVDFIKKKLIVMFGKTEVKVDLDRYPLPYYYLPVL